MECLCLRTRGPGSAGREACLVLLRGVAPCNGRAVGRAPRAQGTPLRAWLALERASVGAGTLERTEGKWRAWGPQELQAEDGLPERAGGTKMPAVEEILIVPRGGKGCEEGLTRRPLQYLNPPGGRSSTPARDPDPPWEPKNVLV